MSDTTWSARIPKELKERISNIMEAQGVKSKDFLEDMINIYNLHKTKNDNLLVESEIDELRSYSQRINDIYVNILNRTEQTLKLQENKHSQNQSEKNQLLADLKGRLENEIGHNIQLKEEIEKINNKLKDQDQERESFKEKNKNIKSKYENTIKELKRNLKNNELLIVEYKEKLNTYGKFKEELEETKKKLEKSINEIENEKKGKIKLEKDLYNKDKEIKELNQNIENIKKSNKIEIDRLNIDFEKKLLEKEKLINKLG